MKNKHIKGEENLTDKIDTPLLTRRDNYFVILNFDLLWKYRSDIINCFLNENQFLYFCLNYGILSEVKDIVDKPTVIESSDWIEPWWKPEVLPNLLWFSTKSKKEIEKAIRYDQFFTCVILNDKTDLLDHSYVISNIEDDVGNTLCIYTHNEYEFRNVVIPKILGIINGLEIDIHE